jgi:hypothetical protein
MVDTQAALALRQRMRFSISGLARAKACAGSVVLPRVRWDNPWREEGQVVHGFLVDVGRLGEAAALERVPEEHREACEGIELDQLPTLDPDQFGHEVGLAFDVAAGTARLLGKGLSREQVAELRRDGEITGVADVMGVAYLHTGERILVVADYKRGWLDTGPIREHWQLRGYALLGCLALGIERARILRIRIPPSGRPWYDWTTLDAMDMEATAYAIGQAHEEAEKISAALDAGVEPDLHRGDHCTYCPALPRCPAYVALVRDASWGRSFADVRQAMKLPTLTTETARVYRELATQLRAAAHWIESGLDQLSREQPFPLGDGRLYGPHPVRKPKVAWKPGAALLEETFGEYLDLAAPRHVTITSLRAAFQAMRRDNKAVRVAPRLAKLREALQAGGALTVKITNPVGPYKPKDGQDDGEEEVGGDDDGAGGGGD